MRLKFLFMLFWLMCASVALGGENKITLDLHRVSMQEALTMLAKTLHFNLVLNPEVSGNISLHLQDISAEDAFNSILASHQLMKWKVNQTWYVGSKETYLQAKENNLKFRASLDESSPLVTRLWQIRYAKAEDIAHLLQDNSNTVLSQRAHVRFDARTNMLCVQEIATHMEEINHLIQRLDVPVRQVLIKARLATVDNDFERTLGLHFDKDDESRGYSLVVTKLADGTLLDVQLSALEKSGRGELISSPSLFAANQETASIESGEEIPYQEVSKSGATSVAFKKAVLSLKVTPQILPGNKILLEIQVNQDKASSRLVLGVPAINTRQMSTHVLLKNGETIVLGGIFESNREEGEQSVPFLGKIPVLGWLFREQNRLMTKRELLIFVTPHIVE